MIEVVGDFTLAITARSFVGGRVAEQRRIQDGEDEDSAGAEGRRDAAEETLEDRGVHPRTRGLRKGLKCRRSGRRRKA